jgi:hypothetical protein
MNQVRIARGEYHYKPVSGVFTLIKPYQNGKRCGFITVVNDGTLGNEPVAGKPARILVKTSADFEYLSGAGIQVPAGIVAFTSASPAASVAEPVSTETDEEIMNRIAERFGIQTEMTRAAIAGQIRAMIISGAPGVGKSHGVVSELEKYSLLDQLTGNKIKYEVVKGATTAVGLYATLYKHSDRNHVLVFDDCDSVFADELSLNILKAALDSGKSRKIFWNSDSHKLRNEGIPDSFSFNGTVIFITNINFEANRSTKLQDHLAALQSRCHFLDLTIHSAREKMLRIRQVHRDVTNDPHAPVGGLFSDYNLPDGMDAEILDFIWENHQHFREISLRMALKVADLYKINPEKWKLLAKSTCMKPH